MDKNKIVKIVVLGDIGRSPRMQYHALSLANNGCKVIIIGYAETTPLLEIVEHPNITISKLHPLVLMNCPNIIKYIYKAIWQTISLLMTLFITGSCDFILCQNPPAIPTLPICRFYCLLTKSKLVVDWHNYAYSIMALTLPSNHVILKIAKFIEGYFGASSNYNICVTSAMKVDLLDRWNIVAKVLYDRPPKIFHPITLEDKHQWFLKIGSQHSEFLDSSQTLGSTDKTAFTYVQDNRVYSRADRPGLLFSSTSWTPDEDFKILLESLQVYESNCEISKALPKLICVITGKGPMKDYYLELIDSKKWQHVTVIAPWLEAADYPKMVASADLGVCLHTSSSGLDLPMKVVDMFGAGLPVCAYEYKCLSELVQNGINGYTFSNSDQLSKQILQWFYKFPNNPEQNALAEKMRNATSEFQKSRWEDNWNLRVKSIFDL